MIELATNELECVSSLCEGKNSIDLKSVIEGNMGTVWVDNKQRPVVAIILVADFCHLLGDINKITSKDKVIEVLKKCRGQIVVVYDISWIHVLKENFKESFRSFKRYALKREVNDFNKHQLSDYIAKVSSKFKIQRINDELYAKILSDKFMADCCSNYKSLKHFKDSGIGYVIEHNEEIISGASSYSYCKGYIDITIGTKEDYRNKGLALACASSVILECLEKNIIPVWDAVDMRSVKLARKLGYIFDKEYKVYSI
ncbi:GNAT family N-acetyltransferase [Clostridiaceae bacterium M8S5]|nr:GNAT family N-acetyltransferase [Clostridiaceae bacterium M8S5]